MGETSLTRFSARYDTSCKVVTGTDSMTTTNSSSLATRETMERPGVAESMMRKLHDSGDPARINYPLADLVRLKIRMLAQMYADHDDATPLRKDPALRMSKDSRRSLTPLEPDNARPCQSTMSRSVEIVSSERNQQALREATVQAAVRRRDEFSLAACLHGHGFGAHKGSRQSARSQAKRTSKGKDLSRSYGSLRGERRHAGRDGEIRQHAHRPRGGSVCPQYGGTL